MKNEKLQKLCDEFCHLDLDSTLISNFDGICVFWSEIYGSGHILDLETGYELENWGIGFIVMVRYRHPVIAREIKKQVNLAVEDEK